MPWCRATIGAQSQGHGGQDDEAQDKNKIMNHDTAETNTRGRSGGAKSCSDGIGLFHFIYGSQN